MGSDDRRHWDVLVVGAGSAGATLAARLSEDPSVSVLLLEAGPDYLGAAAPPEMRAGHWTSILDLDRFPQFQWPSLVARRGPGRPPLPYWRGRGVGGSSSINGQVALRPPLAEFTGWMKGWGPQDVLPAFIRLEDDEQYGAADHHGRGGPIPISRVQPPEWGSLDLAFRTALLDAGHPWCDDANAPDALGVSPFPYNARDGHRVGTNEGYLDPARDRPNLTIVGDTLVERVLLREGRAVGVLARRGGEQVRHHADEVVLSAGAAHSPALLMRSGIGPAGHLAGLGITPVVDLPVGDGLQEHPHVYLAFPIADGVRPPANGRHANACLRYSSGLPDTSPGDVMAMVNGPAPEAPDLAGLGLWVTESFSRGRLRLASADPQVDPDIGFDLVADRRDLDRLRGCLEIARTVLEHPDLAAQRTAEPVGIDGTPLSALRDRDAVEAWVRATVDGSAHISCTCRMAPAEDGGVVDESCRVYGVDGLRVVDLSVTPQVPGANTNLTAVMIGELMSERMARAGR